MKFIILLLITFPVFACQIQVPTSEAQRTIEAMSNGNGVAPLYSCADKPDETCHCADEIIWEHAEIFNDSHIDEESNQVIWKKVLRNSLEKKAAHEAKLMADKLAEDAKLDRKKQLKDELKLIKKSDLTSNAKTVDAFMKLKELIDLQE